MFRFHTLYKDAVLVLLKLLKYSVYSLLVCLSVSKIFVSESKTLSFNPVPAASIGYSAGCALVLTIMTLGIWFLLKHGDKSFPKSMSKEATYLLTAAEQLSDMSMQDVSTRSVSHIVKVDLEAAYN